MKPKKEVLAKLFLSTLYLSAFTFGGGYVIVTLLKKKFVDEYHWIEENEMLDLVAIAQSAPGAVAVNGAIVVGFKLAGIPGALTAIIATIIPPFVIISLISVFYAAFRSNLIISRLLEAGKIAVTMGMRMPKVPQEVPEAKARMQATTKMTAGSMLYRLWEAPIIRSWTNTSAPRVLVMVFRDTAMVRMMMGGTIATKPLGTQAMASLKLRTRRAHI